MSSYYLNEAVIDLPERPFVDKTIHGLEAKLPGGKTLGVLVHRRPLEGAQPLRQLVDESVALNVKRLLGFSVTAETEAVVGGLPAIFLQTRWRNERASFYQAQAHVVVDETLLIFAVSGPLDEQAICDQTFARLVESITWRAD